MTSECRYATEDNIRYLITLIKEEFEKYVSKETFRIELDNLGKFESSLSLEKVAFLPDKGEPNVIYLIRRSDLGDNAYNEYFWDEDEERFELIGAVNGDSDDSPIPESMIEKLFREDD